MGKPFSLSYKNKMIERLTGTGAVSAGKLARETGMSQPTLSRWLREAHTVPDVAKKSRASHEWTVDEKIRILGEAAKLSGPELTVMLQKEGLSLAELERWRLALVGEAPAGATNRRIRSAEGRGARRGGGASDPRKKVDQMWGDADDDTDEENEK